MYIGSRNSLIASAPAVQAAAAAAGEAVWAVGGVEFGQGEPSTLNPWQPASIIQAARDAMPKNGREQYGDGAFPGDHLGN